MEPRNPARNGEDADPRDDPSWAIGVSLSGGGYRATAFALGALVALHDADVWDRIRWIASASGGSFANAAVAARLQKAPSRTELDRVVAEIALTIISPHTLMWWRRKDRDSRDGGPIGKIYAGGIQRRWTANTDGTQVRLADLSRPDRMHVFMAADLASSLPIVLSDRLIFSEPMNGEWQFGYRPGSLLLATAVRASATFPGLPAVRVAPEDLGDALEEGIHDLLLVDGGTWNNLATDWHRLAQWFDRTEVIPASIPRQVDFHLVVDSSAPATRPHERWTRRKPFAFDTAGLPAVRAFKVAVNSTVAAYRSELREREADGSTAVVDLLSPPIARSSHQSGLDEDEWRSISQSNKGVGTFRATLTGLEPNSVMNLLAHAHAQVAAHLSAAGVPVAAVERSAERFASIADAMTSR